MNNEEIEKEIIEKGLTAPRVSLEDINNVIESEMYYIFPGTMLTVCCLTLKNGFHVIGESACVDPDNFNKETGEKISRGKAFNQIWPLEGYRLKQKMFEENK